MRRALALGAVLVGLAGCGSNDDDGPSASATSSPDTRDEVVASIGSEGGFDAQKIYKDEAPGVVTIQSLFGSQGGEGSGFVLNDEGEIVTNAHVVTTGEGTAIKRASEVYVEFADGNRVAARASASRCRSTSSSAPWGSYARRGVPAMRTWASPRSRCIRSSSTTSSFRRIAAHGCRRSSRAARPLGPACAGAAGASSSRAPRSPAAAT